MSSISKISPDGGTSEYNLKDANAQPRLLDTPLVISGKTYTTVEEALSALLAASGASAYVQDDVLHIS